MRCNIVRNSILISIAWGSRGKTLTHWSFCFSPPSETLPPQQRKWLALKALLGNSFQKVIRHTAHNAARKSAYNTAQKFKTVSAAHLCREIPNPTHVSSHAHHIAMQHTIAAGLANTEKNTLDHFERAAMWIRTLWRRQ